MIKFIGNILFKIYNLFFSYLDKISNVNNLRNYDYYEKGFGILNLENVIYYNHHKFSTIRINKYLKKIIFSEKEIINILNLIFIKNKLKEMITKTTGFNYSIDFFTAYRIESIDQEDEKYGWYANHWHKDKPFSKYFIKLIIPLENIEEDMGGIELVGVDKSKNKNFKSLKADFKMVTSKNEILIFSPNLCYHKAGKLASGKIRQQIMLQLNPSKDWTYNSELFNIQKNREPKFPFFSYFFLKKIKI